MLEKEVSQFKEVYLQKKIDNLRNYTKEFKEAIDSCRPAGFASEAMSIGILTKFLESENKYLTRKQYEEIDNLKREYAIQFQRLAIGKACECKPKVKT